MKHEHKEWPCEHISRSGNYWYEYTGECVSQLIQDCVMYCNICGAKRPENKVEKSLAEKIQDGFNDPKHYLESYAKVAAQVAEEHFKQCCANQTIHHSGCVK